MLRATLRSLMAHKGRLVLSTIAIAAGIAFLAGTFVFTDTLKRTFEDLFSQVVPDVVLLPEQEFTPDSGPADAALAPAVLDVVEDTPGVARAEGSVFTGGVVILDSDGEVVGVPGAPAFGASWSEDEDLSPLRLSEGRGPTTPDEVAIDSQAFESGGFELGQEVSLATPGPPLEVSLVGVFRYGSSGNLAGATITAFEPTYAQELLLGEPGYSEIDVLAEDGVAQADLAAAVTQSVAAAGFEDISVQTGEEYQDDQAASLTEDLGFINTFLLVFATVAVVVAVFVILNTFSILVARRSRELALLRALGASRRQVSVSVLGEALVVGLVGSALGLLLGLGLALGLQQLFALIGADIPSTGLVIAPRTVVVSFAVGVPVTMAAALYPAIRAGRVPPLAAMRDDITSPSKASRRRSVVGIGMAAVAIALLGTGLFGSVGNPLSLVGLGALLLFVAVAVLAPLIAGPLVGLLGSGVAATGTVGGLAVRNAQRDRRRTAATASALTVGLALVSAIGVLGTSTSASVAETIKDAIGSDYILTTQTFQPFSTEAGDAVEEVEGVGSVARRGLGIAQVEGTESFISVFIPEDFPVVATPTAVDGDLTLGGGILLQKAGSAEDASRDVGDQIEVLWPSGPATYELGGTFEGDDAFAGPAGDLGLVMSRADYLAADNPDLDYELYVDAEAGVEPSTLREGLEAAVAPFGVINVRDQGEFQDDIEAQVNQLLTIIYALLGLAVIIAILGIVNTLALSVLERTREIGLLRAVGTTRGQMRRMIMWESVVIALFGATLGVALGLVLGVAVQQALKDEGVAVLGLPVGIIVTVFVLSAVVGVLAALVPARRAARMDVLAAIATE
jgi:putative ABC transport system permease protein